MIELESAKKRLDYILKHTVITRKEYDEAWNLIEMLDLLDEKFDRKPYIGHSVKVMDGPIISDVII